MTHYAELGVRNNYTEFISPQFYTQRVLFLSAGETVNSNWVHCRLQCLALFEKLNSHLSSNADSESERLRDLLRIGFLNALLDSSSEMRFTFLSSSLNYTVYTPTVRIYSNNKNEFKLV